MGRELTVKVRNSDNRVIYEDFVCGRDDATNYIAQLVYNRRSTLPEIDEDTLEGIELSDRYSLIFNTNNDGELQELSNIRTNLTNYANKDKAEIQKAKDTLEDLRLARRNCGRYDEFVKFSDAIDETYQWLETEDYSRAGSLLDYLEKAERLAVKHAYNAQIIIELSE